PVLPDVPTFSEAGVPGLDEIATWWGLSAPADLPQEIVDKIYRDMVDGMSDPDIQKIAKDGGMDLALLSPGETRQRIDREIVEIHDLLGADAIEQKPRQ